jgi:VCBS repeat-containing protein
MTIDAAENWTYTLDNSASSVQALNESQHVTDTITLQSAWTAPRFDRTGGIAR